MGEELPPGYSRRSPHGAVEARHVVHDGLHGAAAGGRCCGSRLEERYPRRLALTDDPTGMLVLQYGQCRIGFILAANRGITLSPAHFLEWAI